MRIYDVIRKKRDGFELSEEEIRFFIKGFTDNTVADYQAAALVMACFIRGMTPRETVALTMAMAESGDMADLSAIVGIKVDKHSTGGVGDKTSLVVCPIAAALGVKVAKMSGRGLGHTGGTVDKLESIPGFRIDIPRDEFISIVNKTGIALVGQSGNFAPADKLLYSLRDVTATVESIPLITSSIMSKKIAAGADAIVLDVKTGSGAFMKTVDESRELARSMVEIGRLAERRVIAVITNMDIPLGKAVGNSLEVIEAVETLKGRGPKDFAVLCEEIATNMVVLAGYEENKAREMVRGVISDGRAFEKLVEMVEAQGGDSSVLYDTEKFAKAEYCLEIKTENEGYLCRIDTERVGVASLILGAGREKKTDVIDYSAGVIIEKKPGDFVKKGDVLARLYTNNKNNLSQAEEIYRKALEFDGKKPEIQPVVYEKIG